MSHIEWVALALLVAITLLSVEHGYRLGKRHQRLNTVRYGNVDHPEYDHLERLRERHEDSRRPPD